ncbi:MAG TPA: ECF transporter S component, partial [Erysipelotrichaceae bacterium]|nr:ECF transporter S component [Erysipelotrichaceae bacterium]
MKKSQNLKKMTLFALFIAIEMMLLMTPFGYLRIGPISATLMHIPVIL